MSHTIARSLAAKKELLSQTGAFAAPKRKAAKPVHPDAISTPRLIAYMLGSGIACGGIWYLSLVLGITRAI